MTIDMPGAGLESSGATWRKSSRCGETFCVEVAFVSDFALIRDSKSPEKGHLAFDANVWSSFTTEVKAGRFDRL
jgi:hypothetical protein